MPPLELLTGSAVVQAHGRLNLKYGKLGVGVNNNILLCPRLLDIAHWEITEITETYKCGYK